MKNKNLPKTSDSKQKTRWTEKQVSISGLYQWFITSGIEARQKSHSEQKYHNSMDKNRCTVDKNRHDRGQTLSQLN